MLAPFLGVLTKERGVRASTLLKGGLGARKRASLGNHVRLECSLTNEPRPAKSHYPERPLTGRSQEPIRDFAYLGSSEHHLHRRSHKMAKTRTLAYYPNFTKRCINTTEPLSPSTRWRFLRLRIDALRQRFAGTGP